MAKILNLEWASFSARDRNIASLISNYLRFQGHEVHEESIFNGAHSIYKLRPDLVFITDITGARVNYEVAKYAKESGSLLVTYVSEGTTIEKILEAESYAWGKNISKQMIEDLNIVWSEPMKKAFDRTKKESERIKIVGGVGFDLFILSPLPSRFEILSKYGKSQYQKVIGVGLWDFGFIEEGDYRAEFFHKFYKEEDIKRIREDGRNFNRILKDVVTNNPDILFILKEHPATQLGDEASAIVGLRGMGNTLVLKGEEHVFPLIAISDFWLVYDSTTCLESWLINKQTILLNPSGTGFLRSDVFLGSPHVQCGDDLQKSIVEFYSHGALPGFSEKAQIRKDIVKNMITFADGLNHVRAGNAILDLLESSHDKIKLMPKSSNLWHIREYLKNHLPWVKDRSFTGRKFQKFSNKEVKEFSNNLYENQVRFYRNLGMSKEQLRKINDAT